MQVSLALIFAMIGTVGICQHSINVAPYAWGEPLDHTATLPEVILPALDLDQLDLGSGDSSGSFRYGVQRPVVVDVLNTGQWRTLPNGEFLCRVIIQSPGAAMLSVQFNGWELPEGGVVHLFNMDRTFYIGGFDNSNRSPLDGSMATAVVPGDEVIIEYRWPARSAPGELRVSSITHGYSDVFGFAEAGYLRDYYPGFPSQPCHINVNCPAASAWQSQKKSVVMFLRPDGGGCTGVMLNSVHAPGRPLFHMANHCYQPTTSQYVFYFNYEAPACVGDTGQTAQTLTGASLLANDYYDDFALLRLVTAPQAAGYNVFYAGWDRSGSTPQSGAVIHHPAYDVKKITFDTNPLTSYTSGGFQMWRSYWDQGIVEGVSSGGPLFDQNKRMVGHMLEGAQDCSNATTLPTGCSKFSVSWDGPSSASRLRDWLDSANTGVNTLNGFTPGTSSPNVQLRLKTYMEGPFNTTNGMMDDALRSSSLIPLSEPYTALGYVHVAGGGGGTTTSGVLAVTGNNAIVDWVVVELRHANDSALVVASRSALIQRDGDVVATDGTSAVSLTAPSGLYYIAVRHRNHLGIMAAGRYTLGSTALTLDLSNNTVALFGGAIAAKTVAGKRVMYAGDVVRDNRILYTNTGNDRDPILTRIGGVVPTATVNGYLKEDVNMDGVTRYTGAGNDRDIILLNIGGTVPTNNLAGSIP